MSGINIKSKAKLAMRPISQGIFLGVASCIIATSASAQDVQQTIQLDEIIVTAQKREQSVQDVPITINTYAGDDLVNLGITKSDQLGQFTPGLDVITPNGEGSQLTVFIRGSGLTDFNSNNAGPIGIYVDEVYLSSPGLTTFDIFDLDRVEVLRGPQGTLYGRNTTGGAIKFVSNTPTEEFSGQARLSVENFGTSALEGAISGSLSDNVRGRLAVIKRDSDGFVENLLDDSDTSGYDTQSYRAFLDVDVSQNFTVRLNVHGGDIKSDPAATSPLGLTSDGSTPCPLAAIQSGACVSPLGYRAPDDVRTGNYDDIRGTDLESKGGYLQMDWDTGNVQITSVTAFDELDRFLFEDTDGSPTNLLEIEFGVDSETFSQELRATGSSDRYEWLIGGFYLTEELNQNQTIDLFRDLRAFTGGNSDPNGVVTGAPILFARGLNTQDTDTFAVFGQTTISLNDNTRLTLGGRYTDEDREFSARGQLEDPLTFGPAPFIVYDAPNLETSSSEVSWRIALEYQASQDALIYSSASRGFKSGGFNGGFLALDPAQSAIQLQPFDPEFLTAYELGLKSDWLDGRIRFNTALFFNDFEDLQVFAQVNTDTTPLQILDNASDAEAYGLEFELTVLPAQGWMLGLSGAFMESELKSLVPGAISGDEIENTPNTSLTGLIRYEHDMSNGGQLSFQGSTAYRDDTRTASEVFVGGNGYTLTNLRASYASRDRNWDISAFINNATDEEYILLASNLSDFGFVQRYFSEPRTYGIEASIRF